MGYERLILKKNVSRLMSMIGSKVPTYAIKKGWKRATELFNCTKSLNV